MAECWTLIPLLKYSPGRVLYYKKTLLKSVIHNSRTPFVSKERAKLVKYETYPKKIIYTCIYIGRIKHFKKCLLHLKLSNKYERILNLMKHYVF